MARHCSPREIYLMVMGATGTGKSTFIRTVCDGVCPQIGHQLESCEYVARFRRAMILMLPGTSSIESYSFTGPDGIKIHLLDTPGLDDSSGSDLETIQNLANWLKEARSKNIELRGVLYLHKITDNRMSNSSQENLELFQAICGDRCWSATALVTTMWSQVDSDVGHRRECELCREDKYWGSLVKGGAKVCRFHDSKASALEIINKVAGLNRVIVPRLQQEVAVENMNITDTTAFQHLPERHVQEQQRLQAQIDNLKQMIGDGQGRLHSKLQSEVTRLENQLRVSHDQQSELSRKVIELQQVKQDSGLCRILETATPIIATLLGDFIKHEFYDC